MRLHSIGERDEQPSKKAKKGKKIKGKKRS